MHSWSGDPQTLSPTLHSSTSMELEEKFEKMTEGSFYKHLADRVKDSGVTRKPKFKKKDEVLRRKTTKTIQDELEEF